MAQGALLGCKVTQEQKVKEEKKANEAHLVPEDHAEPKAHLLVDVCSYKYNGDMVL